MKVVTKTGLVPVHTRNHKRIFGVSPETARAMVAKGEYILVDIPDDVDSYELGDPVVEAKEPVPEVAPVVIPDDWQSMHHMKKVKLAKELYPDFKEKWTPDLADEKIEEEVQRRAADADTDEQSE